MEKIAEMLYKAYTEYAKKQPKKDTPEFDKAESAFMTSLTKEQRQKYFDFEDAEINLEYARDIEIIKFLLQLLLDE